MTNEESAYKTRLAELGCALCRVIHGDHEPGPVELHHYRGGGWGRGTYRTMFPLCAEHHRGSTGIHGLGTKGFDAFYGERYGATQRTLLEWTHKKMDPEGSKFQSNSASSN